MRKARLSSISGADRLANSPIECMTRLIICYATISAWFARTWNAQAGQLSWKLRRDFAQRMQVKHDPSRVSQCFSLTVSQSVRNTDSEASESVTRKLPSQCFS